MTETSYTVVNLKGVEDRAPGLGLGPNLESRFATRALELEKLGLSYFRIAPGFRLPSGHRHGEQEEVYVVVSGSVRMKVDDEVVELGAWDAIRVPGRAARCPEAGPNGAELIVAGAPRLERSDAELLRDWWTD